MIKKLFTVLAILVLLFMISAGIGLAFFNHYIQGDEFREKLTRAISSTLGTQFHLAKIKFNIFSGFDLDGIEVENPPPNNAERFLKIQQVRLSYSPWALLNRKLVIREFSFNEPEIAIQFSPDGSSNIPQVKKSEGATAPMINTTDLKLNVVLDHFNLNNGKFALLNSDHELLFSMDKADMQGTYELTPRGAEANGKIHVGELKLGSTFKITDANSTIKYNDHKLVLPDMQGKSYGGIATGLLEANLGEKEPSFNMSLKLADADVPSLVGDFGKDIDWVEGKLLLTAQLEGSLLQPKLLTGKGDFEIQNTGLAKFKLLKEISQILLAPDVANTQFKSIKGTFKVADQKITFFNIEAISDLIQISGAGSVTFDRQVDFDVLFAISDKVQIPSEIESQLTKREDNFRTITFKVSGSLNDLKTNLLGKVAKSAATSLIEKYGDKLPEKIQKKANELLDFLKKKNEPESAVTPPPSNTPSPQTITPPPAENNAPAPTNDEEEILDTQKPSTPTPPPPQ